MPGEPAFEVASVTLRPTPIAVSGGIVLADLSIRYGILEIHGAQLLRRDDGSHALLLPRNGRRSRVFVASGEAYRHLLSAAQAAVRAIAVLPLATALQASEPTP